MKPNRLPASRAGKRLSCLREELSDCNNAELYPVCHLKLVTRCSAFIQVCIAWRGVPF